MSWLRLLLGMEREDYSRKMALKRKKEASERRFYGGFLDVLDSSIHGKHPFHPSLPYPTPCRR
jgi:hypothetical protein